MTRETWNRSTLLGAPRLSAESNRDAQVFALLADNSLILRVDPSVAGVVGAWLPRHRSRLDACDIDGGRADLVVTSTAQLPSITTDVREEAAPTLTLGGVRAHIGDDDVRFHGVAGLRGDVDLRRLRATIALDVARGAADIHGGLTLAAALLIGRLGRALVHAATIVDPHGRGWMLVGDSHAGKTTTCATLISAGWRYVADDQIVLSESGGGIAAEGWPKQAHLDPGWRDGTLTTTRVGADLGSIRPDAWAPHAMVSGVLFPSIDAERPTSLSSLTPADALGRLIRQSPWLLADRQVAPSALALLTRVVATGCFALSLGRDGYANAERLTESLAPITRIG